MSDLYISAELINNVGHKLTEAVGICRPGLFHIIAADVGRQVQPIGPNKELKRHPARRMLAEIVRIFPERDNGPASLRELIKLLDCAEKVRLYSLAVDITESGRVFCAYYLGFEIDLQGREIPAGICDRPTFKGILDTKREVKDLLRDLSIFGDYFRALGVNKLQGVPPGCTSG